MKKPIEEYARYLQLTHECGSKPVRFVDAFEETGAPPKATIKHTADEPAIIFAGLPSVSNVSVAGRGKVTLIFGRRSVVENIQINVAEGDLTVFFGPYCEIKNLVIQSFDMQNYLHFGARTTMNTANFLLQGSEKAIFVGHDCMFSTNIFARTSDSHSMLSYATGNRINRDDSIIIGDHVWVGRSVSFNKGARVTDDVIVGQGSVVSGKLPEKHCCYVGMPAKKVREDVTWDRTRVECRSDIAETFKWRPQAEVINKFLCDDALLSIADRSEAHVILRQKYLVSKAYRWLENL
jgi:acetyltransferase-like isoleucine patch superfamily enzyme